MEQGKTNMNITPTNESPDEVKVEVEKIYNCYICEDTGEIDFDERDSDSHQFAPTGVRKCVCKLDTDEYEPETI